MIVTQVWENASHFPCYGMITVPDLKCRCRSDDYHFNRRVNSNVFFNSNNSVIQVADRLPGRPDITSQHLSVTER